MDPARLESKGLRMILKRKAVTTALFDLVFNVRFVERLSAVQSG